MSDYLWLIGRKGRLKRTLYVLLDLLGEISRQVTTKGKISMQSYGYGGYGASLPT